MAPSPGLTLVVGRNGSGKSSFAEALEVLLTGEPATLGEATGGLAAGLAQRALSRTTRKITAEFLMEGAGLAVAQRAWPAGADFTGGPRCRCKWQGRSGQGIERLGWSTALADYRPFLSHSEMEAFFGSPSGLYELLVSVLGLEDLALAAARLAQVRKAREAAVGEVSKRLPGLLGRLEATGDERAAACRRALAGRSWDLAAARSAAVGA